MKHHSKASIINLKSLLGHTKEKEWVKLRENKRANEKKQT